MYFERIIEKLKEAVTVRISKGRRYLSMMVNYLRTSETVFLLLFANIIGIGSGFGAVFFRWLIKVFTDIFFGNGQKVLSFMGHYYVILVPAIGGIIVGLIIYFFASETKGHGVPEVMLAVAKSGSRIRPRVAAIKALVSSICIGSGGSVGREGPIVQIGSALGSTLGQMLKFTEDKTRILVACGAGGGIAATFNAPIAGIFFALEVILREYGTRYFSSVVLSAVTATIISRTFLGSNAAFVTPPYELTSNWEIFNYFVLGFLAAMVGWAFIKVLYKTEDLFNAIKVPEYVKPAIGGLMLGMIGLYFPQVFGVGYPSIELTLNGKMATYMILSLVGLKLLATSLSLGSGGSGGVFAPSLFIGSMLGSSFGLLIKYLFPAIHISPGAYALVGMGAVFAGAAQAPITAIMILFEMTGDYKIILPLMITCVIATVVVKRMTRDSIYTLKLTRRGIDIMSMKSEDLIYTIKVNDAMFTNVITVSESTLVRDAGLLIKKTTHRGFPVLDDNGLLSGMVTHKDINKALGRDGGATPVSEIMTRNLVVCFPEDTLKTALERLGEKNIGRIPVVDQKNHKILKGLITRKAIITAYNREFIKRGE